MIKPAERASDVEESSRVQIGEIETVSEPRAVATGSGSPARFLRVPPDPVATALGSDTMPEI